MFERWEGARGPHAFGLLIGYEAAPRSVDWFALAAAGQKHGAPAAYTARTLERASARRHPYNDLMPLQFDDTVRFCCPVTPGNSETFCKVERPLHMLRVGR
jgi:hypothetical protein